MPANVSVVETVKGLITNAKKFKSFSCLIYLHALQQFITLREHYMLNPKVKNPMIRASHTVAVSIRKGPYFARKVQTLHNYVEQIHTLPPTNAGKHHAHPSLLNNEHITQAVPHYLTVLADG